MAKTIGKLSVVLGANSGPFSDALKKTGKESEGWTEKQAKEEEKRLKKQEDSAKKSAWLKAGLVGAGAAAVGGAIAGAKVGMDDLIKVDQQARMAGVSIGQFRGAMLAAGPAAAAMEQALTSLSVAAGGLQSGFDDGATRAMKRLGLDGSADMEALAKSLAGLDNPAQKAARAYEVLGDSAKGVMHLLMDGGAQLGKGKDLAERFGLGADGKSVAAIRNAKMELEAFTTGITNNLAVGAAPIVEMLSKNFDALAGVVKSGAKAIAYGGAIIVDTWKGLVAVWDLVKIGFEYMVGGIAKGIAWLGDQYNWLSEQIESATGVGLGTIDTSGLKGSGDEWLAGAGKSWDSFIEKMATDKSAITKVGEFFDEIDSRAAKTTKALEKAPFVDALAKKFTDLKKSIEQENPLQKFKTDMAEIAAFDRAGLFKDNMGLKNLMTQKAFAGLQSGVQLPQVRLAGAAMGGSVEAYSAIARHQSGSPGNTPDLLKALIKEAQAQRAEQIRIGRELEDAIRGQNLGIPARGI